MILLDTNALLFLVTGHRRARPLARHAGHLVLSPVTLLELTLLEEAGRGRFAVGGVARAREDDRWMLDDPPLDGLIEASRPLSWTRDPFDRLLAAHALYRGWRLATSDDHVLEHLPNSRTLPL